LFAHNSNNLEQVLNTLIVSSSCINQPVSVYIPKNKFVATSVSKYLEYDLKNKLKIYPQVLEYDGVSKNAKVSSQNHFDDGI
jgi:hypothetical protein